MKIYKFINSNICNMIILFTLYSFLGWTCEVLYAYSLHHHFVNRGFFTGPFALFTASLSYNLLIS